MQAKTGRWVLLCSVIGLLGAMPATAQVDMFGIGGVPGESQVTDSGIIANAVNWQNPTTRGAFNGRADHSSDRLGLYYLITGGKFVNGQTVNGNNGSGGVYRFIHDDPVSNSGHPGAFQTWARDDWFPENAGWALTLKNDGTILYDNNGIETHTTDGYYDDTLTSIAGLYMGYGMSNNYDWIYCGYFKLNEATEIDTIIGYFDGTGYYGNFDPANPAIGYRMNIYSSTFDGTHHMPAINCFDGDVFSSDTVAGTFSWSDTGEARSYSGWDGSTDPIYRLTYELDSPITLPAGEYFFSHDAVFVMPPVVQVNADWAGLVNGEIVTIEDVDYTIGYDAFPDLLAGTSAVAPGGIVHVLSDLVTPAQVVISKSMDIAGDGSQTITLSFDTGTSGDPRGWFLVDAGVELNVEGLAFDGSGHLVYQGFRHKGFGSFMNCSFANIKHTSPYHGIAIAAFGADGPVHMTDCTFEEIGRVGVLYFGAGLAGSEVLTCEYTGKGEGDWLDYFLDVSAGATVSVDSCSVTDNKGVASTDGSTSAGILVTDLYGPGTNAVVENSTLTANTVGVLIGYNDTDTSDVTVHNCDLSGNTSRGIDLVLATGFVVNASGNYWGEDLTDAFDTQMDYSPYQLAAFDMSELQVTLEGEQVGTQGRIQEAIEMVSGSTIYIAAGLYNENIDVNVAVELIGEGSGPDPLVDTIIAQNSAGAGDTKIGVVQVRASGASASEPILLKDLRIAPEGMAAISVGRFTEATDTSVAFVELDNVKVVGTNTNPSTEQERGLYVDRTSTLSDVEISGCAFDNLTYGWYLHKDVSAETSTVQNISVTDTTFNHNNHKGIYVEKLSDAVFENCTFDSNGYDASILPSYFAPWSAGVDINLKAGTYSNLTFECCTITGNALGGAKEGVGLTIKGRDDGGYSAHPAIVDAVEITDCTVTGNERGIRLGEPSKDNATPTNVVISGCSLHGNTPAYTGGDGSPYGDLINMSMASVDARNNYWGGDAPDSHIYDAGAGVDAGPYLLTPPEACGTALEPILVLVDEDGCHKAGDQVVINIDLSNALQEVLGGQFFLNYDTSALNFVSAAPGAPFTVDMTPIDNGGMITYRVEVPAGSAGYTGAGPVTMANLTFDLVEDFESCELENAVTFAPAMVPFITRLATPDPDTGAAPLYAQLENLADIQIDLTEPVITAPADATVDADENCEGQYAATWTHTFDTAPVLLDTPGDGGWYKDRYLPAVFTNEEFDGDMRLRHGVNEADSQENRPGQFSGTFYNNQGRKYNVSVPTPWYVQIDIYVPSTWQGLQRQAGIWGTTIDAAGSVSGYPIIAYTEGEGFQYYDDELGGYNTIVPAAEITYDSWYTLKFDVEFDEYVFTIIGPADTDVVTLSRSGDRFRFANVILNVYNFGETYEVYWDNLILGPEGPQASDNCGVTSLTYERQDNPALTLSDPFPKGDTEIIWTASDCAGNTTTDIQTITVEDNTPPTMACPADINADNEEGLCEAALTIPVPSAADNCDDDVEVTGVRDDSLALTDPFPVGTTTITWTATDDDANETVGTQLVIVADAEAPVLTKGTIEDCYPDAASAEAAALAATTVEDNCDASPVVTVSTAGDCNAIITVSAEDADGNMSSVGYNTTIDNTAPVIEPMTDIIVNAAAGSCDAVVTWADSVVTDNCPGGFFDDFESGLGHWLSYNSNISLAGTTGSLYGLITPPTLESDFSGLFSRLGGYESEFNGGYVVELDIYMDLNDPAVLDNTYGWDLSVASNRQNGDHLRDFIFHTAGYDDGRILIAGSNNSNFARRNDLATQNHYAITSSGWYTFQWIFRDAGDGSLAVDLNLVDGGTILWTETRNNTGDDIATLVGGHRYIWFTFLATDSLSIDNAAVNPSVATTTVVVDPPSGTTFPIGDTTVTVTATDGCGNESVETFTVTVNDTTDFQASVQLQGALDDDVTRCITFTFFDCDEAPVEFRKDMTFLAANNWVATASFNDLLCDDYTCVTAQDELHTLTVKLERDDMGSEFYVEDGVYYANFVDSDSDPFNGLGNALLQGDLYDDVADLGVDFIDIVDVGVYITEWGQVYDSNGDSMADGNTPCGVFSVHADINGNGGVDTGDYAFITTNYLEVGAYPCCSKGLRDTPQPRRSITIAELEEIGMGHLVAADLNGDGVLNDADLKLFLSGGTDPDPGSTGDTLDGLNTDLSNDLDAVEAVSSQELTRKEMPVRR